MSYFLVTQNNHLQKHIENYLPQSYIHSTVINIYIQLVIHH